MKHWVKYSDKICLTNSSILCQAFANQILTDIRSTLFISLAYFHIKTFVVLIKRKIYYLHSSSIQATLPVKFMTRFFINNAFFTNQRIWSHLLKISLMENFIFFVQCVNPTKWSKLLKQFGFFK